MSLLLALPSLSSASLSCKDIVVQGQHFDLGELGGQREVHWVDDQSDNGVKYNYTFKLDICKKLEWDKGTDKTTNCKHGTRVCAIREEIDLSGTNNNTIVPIDIAGTYSDGPPMDEHFELLRNSKSHADAGREGFRAELHGGMLGNIKQEAIIEFVCDRNRTGADDKGKDDGVNSNGDGEDKDGKDGKDGGDKPSERLRRRDDDNCEDNDNSLRFCGYTVNEPEKGKKVRSLRLNWRTKYACEDASGDASESSGWGFFTWFVIILFLATASYLIFGSWLNYNRYGARGWDLLPHGDTIRDVPYILKDWARRVTSSIQGPGSRGGYSAV
ncbi:hypothetical protein K505DRAFT_350595 [Melanomma pulvis-pyrius CBS 109.77]|uniref:Autophagy-related protein 27 n=1 Tax=Melanomma pulvis-pyrius CBS 109.77 TaxID=1314802 RepID=A0A6A6X8P9_9PLEO|nr:hypothetical protein K505DRAFT_350595 [Melanomma pulvis-pyrius CBS 109.77]